MLRRLLANWFFWIPLVFRGIASLARWLHINTRRVQSGVTGFWSRFTHFQKNLVVGVVIAVVIHLGHGFSWVQEVENGAMDWMMRLQVDSQRLLERPKEDLGYTFLDMDESAYRAWGEPYHVPRDKLLKLMRYASDGGAKVILVDVDLSKAGTDEKADKALADYLVSYPDKSPDLVLMRTFDNDNARSGSLPRVRTLYFDTQKLGGSVHWAQPLFSVDRGDHVVRRWRLIEPACYGDKPVWMPSSQLMLDILLEGEAGGWPEVVSQINGELPADCSDTPHPGEPLNLKYGSKALTVGYQGLSQRLIYSLKSEGFGQQGYDRLPAELITSQGDGVSTDLVRGRVVVIGASYRASHDIHRTPVGEMPGSLILLNAIKSLGEFGQIKPPPGWVKVLIELLLISVMAYAFARFNSIGGLLITGAGILLVMVPVSFYLFKFGIWVDLAAPVLGMQIHQIVTDYEEVGGLKRRVAYLEGERDDI